MGDPIEVIKAFVSGSMSVSAFRDALYNDPGLEERLKSDPKLPHGTYVGRSVFYFLLELDLDCPGGALNAQDALADFLQRNGIAFEKSSLYEELYDLLLDCQPSWAEVNPKFVQDHVLPQAGLRKGRELKAWLKAELARLYRVAGKKPRWIQSPNWPHGENGPLVFLGQVDLPDYFHDQAAVYVFHDPVSGEYKNIVQVA